MALISRQLQMQRGLTWLPIWYLVSAVFASERLAQTGGKIACPAQAATVYTGALMMPDECRRCGVPAS